MHKTRRRRMFRERLRQELKDKAFARAYEEADLPVRLAMAIARLRERLGLTQGELAKRMGTKQQVVSRLEQGAEINPRLETLAKVAHALGKRLDFSFH